MNPLRKTTDRSRKLVVNNPLIGIRCDPDVADMLDQALRDHPILNRICNTLLRHGLKESGYRSKQPTSRRDLLKKAA